MRTINRNADEENYTLSIALDFAQELLNVLHEIRSELHDLNYQLADKLPPFTG